MGMSMRVKASSLDEVKEKMAAVKRKLEEKKQINRAKEFDLDEKIAALQDEDDQRKVDRLPVIH